MSATRPCPACAGTRFSEPFVIPEQMFGTGEPFDYVECQDCRTVFIVEVPANLGDYYDTDVYYSFDEDPETVMGRSGVASVVSVIARGVLFGPHRAINRLGRMAPRQVRTLVSIFEAVRRAGLPRGQASRVLDVGAGAGTLVFALGLAGMDNVVGIDPFADGDRAIGRRGQLLRRELAEVEGEYDLVMLHHSLEHVPDPHATLTHALALLAPGGSVLVRMPTVSSHAYEHYGTHWIGCDAPRHLTLPSREGFEQMAMRAGFAIDSVVDDSNESQFWASEQFRVSLPFVADSSHFVNPRASRFSKAQIRSWRRESDRLNRSGRGDQAAWVLRPLAQQATANPQVRGETVR